MKHDSDDPAGQYFIDPNRHNNPDSAEEDCDAGGQYYRDWSDVFCAQEGVAHYGCPELFGDRLEWYNVETMPEQREPSIADLSVQELRKREILGEAKYGHPIDVHDGRKWLDEAIEECADQLQYLVALRERLKSLGLI